MGTPADEIYDMFMSAISDFNLNAIYQTSGSAGLNTYLEPWLLKSIDDFSICDQSLEYNTVTQSFSSTLTQRNIDLLSLIMEMYWLNTKVQDITQMNNFIKDKDFDRHSESANLKEKSRLYNAKREEVDLKLGVYSIGNINWDNWRNQNFEGA